MKQQIIIDGAKGIKLPRMHIDMPVKLNDTILTMVDDYITIILNRGIDEIYNTCSKHGEHDIAFKLFKLLPITPYDRFIQILDNALYQDSYAAQGFKYLNIMLKSEDYKLLASNQELYKDIINNKVCSNTDIPNTVKTIQKILIQKYNDQVDHLHDHYLNVIGNHTYQSQDTTG